MLSGVRNVQRLLNCPFVRQALELEYELKAIFTYVPQISMISPCGF